MKDLFKLAIIASLLFSLSTGAFAALDDGLVGHWNFDSGSGNKLIDHSGYGNNGSISGASWVSGVEDSALSFDGSDDGVSIPGSSSLNFNGKETVSTTTWVKFQGTGEGCCHTIVGQRNINSWVFRYDDRDGENAIEFLFHDGNTWKGGDENFGIAKPSNGEWHFLAAVYNGSEIRLYKDGKLIERSSFSGSIQTSGSETTIGTATDGKLLGGLDRVRVYKKALSTSEVKKIYNNETKICNARGSENECIVNEAKKLDPETYSIDSVFISERSASMESLSGQATLDASNSSFISGLWHGSFYLNTSNPVLEPGASFKPENGRIILGR